MLLVFGLCKWAVGHKNLVDFWVLICGSLWWWIVNHVMGVVGRWVTPWVVGVVDRSFGFGVAGLWSRRWW